MYVCMQYLMFICVHNILYSEGQEWMLVVFYIAHAFFLLMEKHLNIFESIKFFEKFSFVNCSESVLNKVTCFGFFIGLLLNHSFS